MARISKSEPLILKSKPLIFYLLQRGYLLYTQKFSFSAPRNDNANRRIKRKGANNRGRVKTAATAPPQHTFPVQRRHVPLAGLTTGKAREKECRTPGGSAAHLNIIMYYLGYFTHAPSAHLRSGVRRLSVPSGFSALRIMPWLSMPRSLRGGRLAMKHTCLPTSSSGL